MPLNVVAIIDAKPEYASAVESALRGVIAASRAEDGCLQYELNCDIDNPSRLVMIERWRDEQALNRHSNMPHMVRLRRAMAGRIERSAFSRLVQLD